jgi:hypothetical protein
MTYSFLMYVIKKKDKDGLIYFSQALVDNVDVNNFNNIMSSFFHYNAELLDEEDLGFFDKTANGFIDNSKKPLVTAVVEKKEQVIVDEKPVEDMRKIKKAITLFEKNGLRMGLDYSFQNGKIRMKKECQEKIKNLLGQ